MKRHHVWLPIFAAVIFSFDARPDIIYNVDFESPPHTLDAPVVTGSGSDTPSGSSGSVITRTGVADFSSQVASLQGAGSLGFSSGSVLDSGISLISWNLAMVSLGPTGPETAAITIGGNEGSIVMFFMEDFSIQVGGSNVASYTLGQQNHFEFIIDLDNDSYDLFLDSGAIIDGSPLNSNFDIIGMNFGRDNLADPTYAIDDFRWEIVPEPSTMSMVLLGITGILLRWKRRE